MRRILVAILALTAALLACSYAPTGPKPTAESPAPSPSSGTSGPLSDGLDDLAAVPLHVGSGVRSAWFELYFTDPANPASAQFSGGIEEPLVAAVDGAKLSVHAAIYSLTLNDVRQALLRAYRRGIDVKLVMESDNLGSEDPQILLELGIPLLGDRRQGLMHDKFVVIDGTEVWTGSMNLTNSGAYLDNNVLMRIRSPEIARHYEAEFNEMYVEDRFGPARASATPYPTATVDGTDVQVYFSPENGVASRLSALLGTATSSIRFLAYSFTSDELGKALLRAQAAGVDVAGVMDADQAKSNQGTELPTFRSAGLNVRLDGNPGQMHEKALIVDGKVVVLGSYNFSASAENSNDENVLVIHNEAIAQQYTREFERIYDLAQP